MPRYAFFDPDIREQFANSVAEKRIDFDLQQIADEYLVIIDGGLDPAVIEQLDGLYTEIMTAGMGLWEASEDAPSDSAAAVKIQLSDGTVANIRFSPDILARLLEVLSPQEVENMVQDIALAVENPTDAPICVQRDSD